MNNLFFTKTNEKENKSVKSKDVWSIWHNYVSLEIVYAWKFVFIFCWEASVKKRDIYSFVCASFNAKDWLNTEIVSPQCRNACQAGTCWKELQNTSKEELLFIPTIIAFFIQWYFVLYVDYSFVLERTMLQSPQFYLF